MLKVFPKIHGTEISLKYTNKFGNVVAAVIGDNGYSLNPENNPEILNETLKVQIMRNTKIGLLKIEEVEDNKETVDVNESFLAEFNSLLVKKDKAPTSKQNLAPKPAPKQPVKPAELKKETPVNNTPNKKNNQAISNPLKKDK